jgi:hypothetical protein
MKKVFKQLWKEFRLQLIMSLLWAILMVYYGDHNKKWVASFIGNFSACLFFTSWIMSQFLRVQKQQKIENDFQHVKEELNKVLLNLENQTKDLIGYSLGSKEIPHFSTYRTNEKDIIYLEMVNPSKYPIFDLYGHWIDRDEKINFQEGKLWTYNNFNIGNVYPGQGYIKPYRGHVQFNMKEREKLRVLLQGFHRNGFFLQFFCLMKVNNELKIATYISSEHYIKFNIPQDFPNYDPNNPKAIFE